MRTLSELFTAAETKQFTVPGIYFRLLGTTGPVDVVFVRHGARVGESASQVEAGYYALPEGGFDRIEITSATAQTVKFAISRGRGGYDRTIGSVDVLSLPPVTISGTPNVKTALATTIDDVAAVAVGVAATLLLAADATRRAVRVLNNGTADIYLGGAGVTTANGCIKLVPGALWVEDDAPGAAWYAISGTAGQNVRVQALT